MGKNLYANAHPVALKEMADLASAVIQGDRIKKEVFLERSALRTASGPSPT